MPKNGGKPSFAEDLAAMRSTRASHPSDPALFAIPKYSRNDCWLKAVSVIDSPSLALRLIDLDSADSTLLWQSRDLHSVCDAYRRLSTDERKWKSYIIGSWFAPSPTCMMNRRCIDVKLI